MTILRPNFWQLVRRFGADLEQLRKLTRPQMLAVAIGLESAGFVDGFVVSDPIQNSFVSSGNTDFDLGLSRLI